MTSMRVIAGSLKGRRLEAPRWAGLRPTSDKLRETLFNVLGPRVAGARVLDGYAGTGAIGIEAMSRGVIDIRDVLYFASFVAFFLYVNAVDVKTKGYYGYAYYGSRREARDGRRPSRNPHAARSRPHAPLPEPEVTDVSLV